MASKGPVMRSRIYAVMAFLLLVGLMTSGCEEGIFDNGVRGSGNMITETRDVSGFDSIQLQASGDVNVSVTGTESLVIEAEDNIMPLLTNDVRGGTLVLGSNGSFTTNRGITYTITVADLTGIEINGSADVTATGIDTGRFEAEITGSGDIDVTGTVDDLDVRISGSGNYDGFDLVALRADVGISGSGNADVNATDTLDASISGSGNIEYTGDPQVSESVSGSGRVSQR